LSALDTRSLTTRRPPRCGPGPVGGGRRWEGEGIT
jgi:hypothetical protein